MSPGPVFPSWAASASLSSTKKMSNHSWKILVDSILLSKKLTFKFFLTREPTFFLFVASRFVPHGVEEARVEGRGVLLRRRRPLHGPHVHAS